MKSVIVMLFLAYSFIHFNLQGQSSNPSRNPILTAVPFVNQPSDARGTGLGNTGVATSPDPYSLFWNPAKLAFLQQSGYGDFGFAGSYDPMYVDLSKNYEMYTSIYKTYGKQTIAASYKTRQMGEISYMDSTGTILGHHKLNDFSIDLAYARQFSRQLSGAVALRYIRSNLFDPDFIEQYIPGNGLRNGHSVAVDMALFYKKDLQIAALDKSILNFGLNISNIGSKMSFNESNDNKDFIPTNLRIGSGFSIEKAVHTVSFSVDLNKLLVPTPPVYDSQGHIMDGKDPDVSVFKGMVQSFYDAPGGFKEEMQEIYYGLGLEYWYDQKFALRGGYYNENKHKGDRQLINLGIGLKYHFLEAGFTYSFFHSQSNLSELARDGWFVTLAFHFNTNS